MLQNNYFDKRSTTDITNALKSLVEAGFSEREIADFARLRAHYSRIPDHHQDYPAILSRQEVAKLTFYRWLVQNKRLRR